MNNLVNQVTGVSRSISRGARTANLSRAMRSRAAATG
jgi:hypothetical protein